MEASSIKKPTSLKNNNGFKKSALSVYTIIIFKKLYLKRYKKIDLSGVITSHNIYCLQYLKSDFSLN